MEFKFDTREFKRFRSAHSRANGFLYTIYMAVALMIGSINWLLGIETPFWSKEFAIVISVCAIVSFLVPRMGYKLSRHIVGNWYKSEFGSTYTEYRKNEKLIDAASLLENET